MTSPIVPALPYKYGALPYAMVPSITNAEKEEFYTRLQLLTRTRSYCLPDASCMLNEIQQNRTDNTAYKTITVAQFLAISLVRYDSLDVVAVNAEYVTPEMIQITIARNESTPNDNEQANALKQVFTKHFIDHHIRHNWAKISTERVFAEDYLRCVLGWSLGRITSRLNTLIFAGSNKGGPKSLARAEKLLTVKKVIKAIEEYIESGKEVIASATEINRRYTSGFIGKQMQLRGDVPILNTMKSQGDTVFDVILSMLRSIKFEIGNFHRMRRLDDYDVSKFRSLTMVCDFLGASRIFEDVLDICVSNSFLAARYQFCRSMRKVGVYRYGIHILYKSMTSCAGKNIKMILVNTLRSPDNTPVTCREDWYEFVRQEFQKLTKHEFPITKAYLEASTDLNKYETSTLAALHAELNLAISRRSQLKKSGEIGVSKDCCITCVAGLSALQRQGYSYTIKQSHAKPYVSRLTGVHSVDREIMKSVQHDFEEWLRRLDTRPDSDVSDHEGDLESVASEEEENLAAIHATHKVKK